MRTSSPTWCEAGQHCPQQLECRHLIEAYEAGAATERASKGCGVCAKQVGMSQHYGGPNLCIHHAVAAEREAICAWLLDVHKTALVAKVTGSLKIIVREAMVQAVKHIRARGKESG